MHFTMALVKECGSLDKEHRPSSLDPKYKSVESGTRGKISFDCAIKLDYSSLLLQRMDESNTLQYLDLECRAHNFILCHM